MPVNLYVVAIRALYTQMQKRGATCEGVPVAPGAEIKDFQDVDPNTRDDIVAMVDAVAADATREMRAEIARLQRADAQQKSDLATSLGECLGVLEEIADHAARGDLGEFERLVCTVAGLEEIIERGQSALTRK